MIHFSQKDWKLTRSVKMCNFIVFDGCTSDCLDCHRLYIYIVSRVEFVDVMFFCITTICVVLVLESS